MYTPETLRQHTAGSYADNKTGARRCEECASLMGEAHDDNCHSGILLAHADAWQADLANADTRITSLMADRDAWQARETELLEALKDMVFLSEAHGLGQTPVTEQARQTITRTT